MKKLIALILAAIFTIAMAAGCTPNAPAESTKPADTTSVAPAETPAPTVSAAPAEEVTFDIFQFKVEINDALKKAIETYMGEHPNVHINLETVGGGADYGAALRAKMQSAPPTIFNIGGPQDTKDWMNNLEDLSGESWVSNAVNGTLLAVTVDGKVYGMPYNIEGYGLVYNKNIFKDAGIDGATLTSFDAISNAFATLKQKIDAGEMKEKYPQLEAVTELAAKETWITGLHTLNVGLSNEFKGGGTEAFNAKTVNFTYKDALKALFDLQADYTSNAKSKGNLNAIDYATEVGGGLAIERVAAIQQGNWIFGDVKNVDENVANNLGILPIPLKGVKEDSIPVGVPMYWCVNSQSKDAQKAAAKEFLNWLYQSDEGKSIVINEFYFIPPFTNYQGLEPSDALGKAVKSFADAGKTMPWVFMGFPTDWGMGVFGTKMQDYFAGKLTFDQVVEESKTAWADSRK